MKYKASALACLIFAFAFPLFSASSVYESRLFGKVSATQGRDEVVLQCESAQKARECASKYMTDILLFGTAVPEGNAIRLKVMHIAGFLFPETGSSSVLLRH